MNSQQNRMKVRLRGFHLNGLTSISPTDYRVKTNLYTSIIRSDGTSAQLLSYERSHTSGFHSRLKIQSTAHYLLKSWYIYIYVYIFYGRIKHEQPNSQFISKNEDKVIWEVNFSIHSGFHYCSELSHNQEIDLGTNFIRFKECLNSVLLAQSGTHISLYNDWYRSRQNSNKRLQIKYRFKVKMSCISLSLTSVQWEIV